MDDKKIDFSARKALRAIDVAIGIVVHHGQLLICQRKPGAVLGGCWEFPGGKIEPDESATIAVVRELREELGITVAPIESLDSITHTYAHATVTLHPFLCTWIDGTPLAIDCVAWKWISAADLDLYPFPEANGSLLRVIAMHPRVAEIKG